MLELIPVVMTSLMVIEMISILGLMIYSTSWKKKEKGDKNVNTK